MIKHTIDYRINQRDKIPMNSQFSQNTVFKVAGKKINLQIEGKVMGKQVCILKKNPKTSTMN